MYRLSINLSDEIADRLSKFSERSLISKTSIVEQALDQYFTEQETRLRLMESMSDPEVVAKVCRVLGLSADKIKDK